LGAAGIRVDAPAYVALAVDVMLRAPARLAAQVEQRATRIVTDLLHPIDGGPSGGGWPFGRRLWESDVLRALSEVEGIDRIDAVEVREADGGLHRDVPADGLIFAEVAAVDVRVEPVVEP
jgi:hypothetical protein